MTDYRKGKIYKIECQETNRIYIGSTCQPTVAGRLRGHVQCLRDYKNGYHSYVSSFSILETGNYKCLLVCNYPCNTKDELTAKEGEYIRQYKNDDMYECVNKRLPNPTEKEIMERKKQWRKDNKEIIKEKDRERNKKYYQDNKEKVTQTHAQYRTDNKEKIAEYKKQYRQTENYKKSHACDCGGKFKIQHKTRHERSKKHMKWEATQ